MSDKKLTPEELERWLFQIGLMVVQHRVDQLALESYLERKGIIDNAELEEVRRPIAAALAPLIDALRDRDRRLAADQVLEMLRDFEGPLQ